MKKSSIIIIVSIIALLFIILSCCTLSLGIVIWDQNQHDPDEYIGFEDDYYQDIEIPEGMEVRDPNEFVLDPNIFDPNDFSLGRPKDLGTLGLETINREYSSSGINKVFEYFAENPRWFLTEEHGRRYAYRRFPTNGGLQNTLNGFYSGYDLDSLGGIDARVIVSFDGPIFAENFDAQFYETSSDEIETNHDKQSSRYESYFVIDNGYDGISVEISESSEDKGRTLTTWALTDIADEITRALHFDQDFSISDYESQIELSPGKQGGIYHLTSFVNPGEAGYVYLKAYEATNGISLSDEKLESKTIEYIGYSDNQSQLFTYITEFTIYEGVWDKFYPARFELWFVPIDDMPERKLTEEIFLIEGWQR